MLQGAWTKRGPETQFLALRGYLNYMIENVKEPKISKEIFWQKFEKLSFKMQLDSSLEPTRIVKNTPSNSARKIVQMELGLKTNEFVDCKFFGGGVLFSFCEHDPPPFGKFLSPFLPEPQGRARDPCSTSDINQRKLSIWHV